MTNHPTVTDAGAQKRPPVSTLHECFDLRANGALIWLPRPDAHFLRPGSARQLNRTRAGLPAGCIGKDGYSLVRLSICGASWLIPAHQIVWAMTRGDWPLQEIDHRNNVRADNRPDNLRLAERPQNMANMQTHRDNKLGVKGVHLHKTTGKYRAKICHNRQIISLGLFDTPEDAHEAYLAKARELKGDFSRGA